MLNVAIVWPNFYLYKKKSMPLIVEFHTIVMVVNDVWGYVPTVSMPPSSYWVCWAKKYSAQFVCKLSLSLSLVVNFI